MGLGTENKDIRWELAIACGNSMQNRTSICELRESRLCSSRLVVGEIFQRVYFKDLGVDACVFSP